MLAFVREFAVDFALVVATIAAVSWWFSPRQREARKRKREERAEEK